MVELYPSEIIVVLFFFAKSSEKFFSSRISLFNMIFIHCLCLMDVKDLCGLSR